MDYDGAYTEYQLRKRTWLRQHVRNIYLKATLKLLKGKTIDFGCGTGELLYKLPSGSIGIEINQTTVQYCQGKGLNVYLYNQRSDNYQLSDLAPTNRYESLLLSHIVEHLEHPEEVLRLLFKTARRLDIKRVVLIVPGKKGFKLDPSHRTFIDFSFLKQHELFMTEGFRIVNQRYFPINLKFIENFFTYHELQIVYDFLG